ncbi:MAG: hypothetical protein JNL54_16825 [Kineosporiaceae bacterium]|nr:hypothetical protein [Kineosporiaceae bacterium]
MNDAASARGVPHPGPCDCGSATSDGDPDPVTAAAGMGQVVRGFVQFPPGPARHLTRLRISLRRIDLADAPAVTLACVDLPDVVVPSAGHVPFALPLPPEVAQVVARHSAGVTLAVRAHADVDGSGQVQVGDLVSTTTTLIATDSPAPVTITVQPVTG